MKFTPHGIARRNLAIKRIIMRINLVVIFMTVAILEVSASGYAQKITLNQKKSSLENIFKEVKKQSGYNFLYNNGMLEATAPVSIEVKNANIEDVLRLCFADQPLEYSIIKRIIVIRKKEFKPAEALPPVTIKGKVKDETGQTLIGVSIKIKGAPGGTSTDANGDFALTVSGKSTVLIFSYLGYDSKEVTVGDQATMLVTLTGSSNGLNEVVVVGYGKQDRKALTSAITTVKADELNVGAINDPAQLLQGKVAGLNINTTGDPNGNPSVILRGASTLRTGAAQQPLYVIDGVPGGDISLISPGDIVSMDILKDAAATSIYGTRAANGVIIVTTKRPPGSQTNISYNAYAAQEKATSYLEMMSAEQLRSFVSANNMSFAPANDQGASTNWQKEVERSSAYSTNHYLSVSGGADKTTYSASLNYFSKQGIIENSGQKRINGRVFIEQKAFNDRLTLGFTLANSVTNADMLPNQQLPELNNTTTDASRITKGFLLQNMIQYLPTVPVTQANGTYTENLTMNNNYNPVGMLNNGSIDQQKKSTIANVTAALKLPFGLTYNVNAAWQNVQNNTDSYYTKYYTTNYGAMLPSGATNGLAYRSAIQSTNKILETFLNYEKSWGDHNLTALLGYSYQQDIANDGFQASNYNFASDATTYYGIGLGGGGLGYKVDWGNINYTELRLISDFARVNYNYKQKYLFQGSIRRDGSSAFGAKNRWGYFPSVSGAWRIIQEDFMKSQGVFSDLKLRVGYGVTGNSLGFDPLISKLQYGSTGYFYYNGTYVAGLGPSQNANPDLKWEKTATANIGLDFALLKGKLTASIDAYSKKTTDLIWDYPVSTTEYPVGVLTANVGSMTNKGVEFVINYNAVKSKDFSWTTSFNAAHNANKITSLSNGVLKADSVRVMQPDGGGQTNATLQLIKVGYPIGQFFTLKYAGKNEAGISQFYNKAGAIVTDASTLGPADYYYAGNAQPKLTLGWSNSFTYKNFDLNFFIRATLGNKVFNATLADLNRPTTANSINIPVSSASESVADIYSYKYSTRYIESGSYLRMDNATLGYTIKNIAKNFRKLRVYFTGNNLFVITGYKGIDPEVNLGGLTPGVDVNNFYPKTRTLLIGVSTTF